MNQHFYIAMERIGNGKKCCFLQTLVLKKNIDFFHWWTLNIKSTNGSSTKHLVYNNDQYEINKNSFYEKTYFVIQTNLSSLKSYSCHMWWLGYNPQVSPINVLLNPFCCTWVKNSLNTIVFHIKNMWIHA